MELQTDKVDADPAEREDSGAGVVVSSMRKLESATKGVNRLTVSIQRNFDRQLLEVAGLGLSVTR
eukprot:CAMPEP_0194030428 /NCGR_PEP_ID=MMETSP0009_2-20130614/3921_1 /TAXON_ID=210454 /ORGANISM="Grammatophora oceanica, Strain CCMP 410" /LENGTH=64 /DNA_ID=CAMNT_0038670375 /DNA_START=941 /DNA_END=1135 /DNA_ORIENTATION=-